MPVGLVSYKDYNGRVQVAAPSDLLKMAQDDPWAKYPYPLVAAILNDAPRPALTDGFSATTLLSSCFRCVVLQEYEEYTLDLERVWKRYRGTQLHYIMERNAPGGSFTERRYWHELGGVPVHGAVDIIQPMHNGYVLQDYKFPEEAPRWDKPWPDHVAQVNFYRWLVDHDTEGMGECQSLGIVYIGQNGIKPLECRKSIEVVTQPGAKHATKKIKVPDIWSDEEVEAHFTPKVEELKRHLDQYLEKGTLPGYPPGFEFYRAGGIHSYSDTSTLCIERFVQNK